MPTRFSARSDAVSALLSVIGVFTRWCPFLGSVVVGDRSSDAVALAGRVLAAFMKRLLALVGAMVAVVVPCGAGSRPVAEGRG
ncbi:MAG: hypothetical protein ACRDRG_05890 [Pseudonocardiaceae bacterium]